MPHPDSPPSTPHVVWRQTTVLRNAQGQDVAVSVGPDGKVWSFHTSEVSGPRLQSLGVAADFVAAGRTSNGQLVVISAQGLNVHCCVEAPQPALPGTATPALRWTVAKPMALPPSIPGATGVRRLDIQTDFRSMRVILVVNTLNHATGAGSVMVCAPLTMQGPGAFTVVQPSSKREIPLHHAARKATGFQRLRTMF